MAILRDEEEQKGQGTSQVLGQAQGQPEQQATQQPQTQAPASGPATIGGGATAPTVKTMPKQQKAGTGTFANLKNYLQAAQGGGRVAQAATQRVQNVASQAQKGIQQAQQAFEAKLQAGSLKGMETAGQEAADIIGTARGATYQAPQKQEPTAVAPTEDQANVPTTATPASAQPQIPTQSQQYFTPEQQQRFAEIINAQYQGPASLQQAGLYEQAARKAQTAQQALQQAQTAGGREQLLRDIFGRTRDYSRGASKLDALLLNTSQQGVRGLQQQAEQAGNIQQQLQAAENKSAAEAANRAAAIQQISSGAREAFTGARTAEETAVEDRINSLIKTPVTDDQGNVVTKADGTPMTQWDQLPEYYRGILKETSKGQVKLSPEEMAVLGVSSGEGLYNLGENLIGNVAAERERLITKDELSRQLALQQLAGLDTSKQLQKDLMYTDLSKAGTQDLMSSLDTAKIREALKGAQEGFKTAAEGADLVGYGKKKVSRGNWSGKRTKTYYADQAGNVADMLRQVGYDVSAESPEAAKSILTDKEALANYLGATSTSRDDSGSMYAEGAARTAAGAGTGASIGATIGALGGPFGTAAGATGGAIIGGALGSVLGDNSTLSNIVGDLGGGRMSSSAMAKVGRGTAKELAIKDLERQYKNFLEGQGFENRLVASQDPEVLARSAALQQLLKRQG